MPSNRLFDDFKTIKYCTVGSNLFSLNLNAEYANLYVFEFASIRLWSKVCEVNSLPSNTLSTCYRAQEMKPWKI